MFYSTMYFGDITVLILLWISVTYVISDDCSKGIRNDVVLINGVCHECPRGLFGVNCSQACPKGTFGKKCSDKCECSEDKFCHPIYGCVSLSNGSIEKDNCTLQNDGEGERRIWTLTIDSWFLVSLCLAGSNAFLLTISCAACASVKGCSTKEYRPKQILDLLSMLMDRRSGGAHVENNLSNQRNGERGNQYVLDSYSEIGDLAPPPPPPETQTFSPLPSTSCGLAAGEYMEPREVAKALSIKSKISNFSSSNENVGYNSLTLKSTSSACEVNNEYAEVIRKTIGGKGKGKGKGKLKMEPLRQIGGRISQFISDKYNAHFLRHMSVSDRTNSVASNVYTDELPPSYPESVDDPMSRYPGPEVNEYFVLEKEAEAQEEKLKNEICAVASGRQGYDLARAIDDDGESNSNAFTVEDAVQDDACCSPLDDPLKDNVEHFRRNGYSSFKVKPPPTPLKPQKGYDLVKQVED